MEERQKKGSLVFAVNGERFELSCIDPSTTLLHFLRSETCFKSPKLGCGEGGCGACVVLVSKYDPNLKKVEDFSVSSCLTLLCSLNGCSITTSEGLGNTRDGFHSIHERFAGFIASQCGFCTPGMCMSFFSALVNADKGNKPNPPPGFSKLTSSEAEKAIAGNLCRCTGYRPIADACKSFAADIDIEDLGFNSFWKKGDSKEMKVSKLPPYDPTKNYSTYPEFLKSESATNLDSSRYPWYSPVSIEELRSLLNSNVTENAASFKLVVGNTGTGYYKETQRYEHYIDLRYIPELSIIKRDQRGIEVGATMTISKLISFLKEENKVNLGSYGTLVSEKLANHMEKIASPFVRNSASVGGNLVMAQKNGFPSDIATLFLGLCATVSLMTSHGLEKVTWEELLSRPPLDSRTVLLSVCIPFKKDRSSLQPHSKFLFETYRAAPRPHGNALAYVNAAFQADVFLYQNGVLINDIQLAFGAYGTKHATRAKNVEEYLTGKTLNVHVLYEALKLVKLAVVPEDGTLHPEYRSSLAVSYVFEFLYPLTDVHSAISGCLLNEISNISVEELSKSSNDGCISQGREQTLLSCAKQVVESSTEYYPVGEPMKKVGAAMQAAGVKGIQLEPGQLTDGVTSIITFKDIPSGGANIGAITRFGAEPLFADDLARCAGDKIAVVVADSQRLADIAARKAVVEYDTTNIDLPILTVEEAVEKSSFFQIPPYLYPKQVGDFSKGMAEADHKILAAEIRLGSEYYFYMETQTALAIPDEDNCMVVYTSSQCPEYAQNVIASCLGLPEHNIRVITRRVGGGFGGKAVRAMPVSTACALAAYKLRRPVRIYVNRNSDMIMTGGRHPMKVTYTVGFKSSGKITALHLDILINAGITEDISPMLPSTVINTLKRYNWGALSFDVKLCKTNLTSKSAMRAPGEAQGSYIAEAIIEHVAGLLSMDVDSVRNENVHTFESLNLFYYNIVAEVGEYTLPSIMDKLAVSSSFFQRNKMIEQFNQKNIWKKRGISRVPIIFEAMQRPTPGKVSILQDGSIIVEVGGIEIGQGLWTKVRQMTAYALGLIESSWAAELVEKVRVIQADTLSIVQGGITAGSTTSESSCEAVRLCCNVLVERLIPLKKQLQEQNGSVDWPTLIHQAQSQSVNLAANSYYVPESGSRSYLNFGAAVSEVEIDILTGETTILHYDTFQFRKFKKTRFLIMGAIISMEERQKKGSLVFAVNGERFELPCIDPSTTLLHFLRSETCFKSPKLGCGEGGCGACVVLVSKYDLKLKKVEDFSVSSCLTLLCSLNGCSITTSEGIGNTRDGFHSIHERFAGFHASQCGFCTPGMCMSFFSALVNADKGNKPDPPPGFSKLTSSEAEKAIAGNLCRCTGYRPIADACKSFAADIDIEDLGFNSFWKKGDSKEMKVSKLPLYDPTKNFSTYPEFLKSESATNLDSSRYSWYSPVSIEELRSLLNSNVTENAASFKFVVGNTGTGYYKETQLYDYYIDLRYIPELSIIRRDHTGIEVGATMTISKLISFLKKENKVNLGSYEALVSEKLANHMEKIASPFVRNSASVGGNLVMAQKNGFPSDIATLFLGLCATVSLMTSHGLEKLTWEELLSRPPLDSRTVLLNVCIPFKKDRSSLQTHSKFLFETYRAAPRPHGNALMGMHWHM
ncbi:aryl-alcohol oxidase 2 [Datura stramonium]|uniref:Ferredoxin n=1 Tax=Datura stramonium TaxID=4076 RepID=A0ABS8RRG8_DATST|nr:aryl-alcohol oxidase 2 [Datura stramonium]